MGEGTTGTGYRRRLPCVQRGCFVYASCPKPKLPRGEMVGGRGMCLRAESGIRHASPVPGSYEGGLEWFFASGKDSRLVFQLLR